MSVKFPITAHAGQVEDSPWMALALQQADKAEALGEVPVGAVIVYNGETLASAHNSPITHNNACAHAEIQAIQQACQTVGNYRLGAQATLYVTLQPCLMCLGAILHARIGRVVIGCEQSRYNGKLENALALFEQSDAWHPCQFETGCMATDCENKLLGFFKTRRKQREKTVTELSSLLHLPNANKETIQELAQLGYHTPKDFIKHGLEQVATHLALRSHALKNLKHHQQAAILASLCDYFKGEPVRSWKQYL